jgi:hypothetical protein
MSALNENMLYTEGFVLDGLLAGELELLPLSPHQKNKIGVIFDAAIPQNILNMHINTINAAKTVWGLDIIGYEITKQPVGAGFEVNHGISSGTVENPKTLLDAGKTLLAHGAEALAIVCLLEEPDDSQYSKGAGVDPIGGVEAIISHYITAELMVPAAHSPAFREIDISGEIVSEKASAEYISATYLPCVLFGLSQAPKFRERSEATRQPSRHDLPQGKAGGRSDLPDYESVGFTDIHALVVPAQTLGSKAVLGALKNNILVCAVKNPCQIDVTCNKLALSGIMEFKDYGSCLDFLGEKFYVHKQK